MSWRRFGAWLGAIWAAAALGTPLGGLALTASSLPDGGGAGAMGLAVATLALTQAALGIVVAAALAWVTAARLRTLGWPRWWAALGIVPAVVYPLGFASWPPLTLALLPLGPPNGLGFGMALALWLAPD